jgi:hypothetical protein
LQQGFFLDGNREKAKRQSSNSQEAKRLATYRRPSVAGAPEGIRTPGPLLRRQLLYPTELQAHIEYMSFFPREIDYMKLPETVSTFLQLKKQFPGID